MVRRVGTTVRVCCVSLDEALHLCDVCYVFYRGLQAVWLLEMLSEPPSYFSSSLLFCIEGIFKIWAVLRLVYFGHNF